MYRNRNAINIYTGEFLYFPIVSATRVISNDTTMKGEPWVPRKNFNCIGLAASSFPKWSRYVYVIQ